MKLWSTGCTGERRKIKNEKLDEPRKLGKDSLFGS
jgi:hypothetical protein